MTYDEYVARIAAYEAEEARLDAARAAEPYDEHRDLDAEIDARARAESRAGYIGERTYPRQRPWED